MKTITLMALIVLAVQPVMAQDLPLRTINEPISEPDNLVRADPNAEGDAFILGNIVTPEEGAEGDVVIVSEPGFFQKIWRLLTRWFTN